MIKIKNRTKVNSWIRKQLIKIRPVKRSKPIRPLSQKAKRRQQLLPTRRKKRKPNHMLEGSLYAILASTSRPHICAKNSRSMVL